MPLENPHWSRLLAEPMAHEEEPMQELVFCQELQPVGGLALEQSAPEGLCSMERIRAAAAVLDEL